MCLGAVACQESGDWCALPADRTAEGLDSDEGKNAAWGKRLRERKSQDSGLCREQAIAV